MKPKVELRKIKICLCCERNPIIIVGAGLCQYCYGRLSHIRKRLAYNLPINEIKPYEIAYLKKSNFLPIDGVV